MKNWRVGGVLMRHPIMVGGGVCKTVDALIPYLHPDLPTGPPEVGSILPEVSVGNTDAPQEYWIDHLESGLNSWGMPSPGRRAIITQLDSLGLEDDAVIANIAGFSPQAFAEGYADFSHKSYIAAVNGNLSCPNKHADRKIPISLDLASLVEVLEEVRKVKQSGKPFWMKIAPAFYEEDLDELRGHGFIIDSVPLAKAGYMELLAAVIHQYKDVVDAVVATNTGPNFMYLVAGKPMTRPNGGLAGLSGKILRPYARRTAKELIKHLSPFMDVIAAGGIWTGDDVADSLDDGCIAVQVTSLPHFSNDGPKAVTTLLESERLQDILINH